jgi:NAD(P)-dependent dehydrogenase (short-subunit alcohol dehydrogenase family)
VGAVAIVTGGASGIGRALGEALVGRGDTVMLADVDEAVDRVAKEVADQGPGSAAPALVDVRDAAAVQTMVEQAQRDHGRLDLMFNNAGVGVAGEVDELSLAHWNRALDVNVRGVIHGVHAVYPLMLAQGYGHIVNTASMAGMMPSPLITPYGMSKHAVVGLSLSLRMEAADRGVKVSVVCPGVIETPILEKGNPPDLPPLPRILSPRKAREYLERYNKPYPPSALAADVLRGVERNRAVIVAPRKANVQWLLQRAVPRLVARAGRKHVAWARRQVEYETDSQGIPGSPAMPQG